MVYTQYGQRRSPRNAGVFIATCVLHAVAIYFVAIQKGNGGSNLLTSSQFSFIPVEEPLVPPPPPLVPVVLTDAFAEHDLPELAPPEVDLQEQAQDTSNSISAPPPPEPAVASPLETTDEAGYGPLTKPRVISSPRNPMDRYPRISIRHKEQGRTVLKLCISITGKVETTEVLKSSGYKRLDEAAADMSLDYVFSPATRDGTPVPVCLPYGINFRLGVAGGRR
jgi:protein TonB